MAFSVYPDVNRTLRAGRRFSASSTSCVPFSGAGHDYVGEEQVDGPDGIDNLQGFGGIGRLERGVAEAFDLGHDVSAHQRIVFDDEDDFMSALDGRRYQRFRGGLVQSRLRAAGTS